LITDENPAVKASAWRLVFRAFPELPPLGSSEDSRSREGYAGLDPASRTDLAQLLTGLLNFLTEAVIHQISGDYDQNPGNGREAFRFADAVRLVRWALGILPDYDDRVLATLSALVDACRPDMRPVEFNVAAIATVFALFPVGLTEKLVVPTFNEIFVDCSVVSDSDTAEAVSQFWEFARRFPASWPAIALCPAFPDVFRALFVAERAETAMIGDLVGVILPLLPVAPEVRSGVIGLFSLPASPRFDKLAPLLPALFALEPEAFPPALAQFAFSALAADSLSDTALLCALSLANSAADRLAAVLPHALAVSHAAVASATARAAIADPLCDFVAIWARSDGFYAELAGALDAHGSALALLRLELRRALPDFARCVRAARRSPAAVEAVLAAIADLIPLEARAAQFARDSVEELLVAETVLTSATERFYRAALSTLGDCEISDVCVALLDAFPDLEESSGALAKAALVAGVRPECREVLESCAPPGAAEDLARTDLWR
jgi:hypothetical protein